MSVNLSKLDISLDHFNAVASGKYNIGQIKLNQDGTGVYRTNSHKTWTIFNTTKISQEEAVAVKDSPVALGLKEDMTFRAVVRLENGSTFSVDLGLTKAQLLDKAGGIMEFLAVDEKAPEVEHKASKRPYNPIADSEPMPKAEIAEKRTKALDGLKDAFDKLKKIDTSKKPDALRNFNEANLDDAVEALQNALVAVRGHDPRNAVIVNAVREAFHQNPHGVGDFRHITKTD